MIRIVTMEREYGAGGSAIAQKLAERLKWKLWDTDADRRNRPHGALRSELWWRSLKSASIRYSTG